jgi:hypothetical protein
LIPVYFRPGPRSTPYTYVSRWPLASMISDRWGRLDAFSDSVVKLFAAFRTEMPVAATTGSTVAAARTPLRAARNIRRPSAPVFDNQSPSCTSNRVRGSPKYYRDCPETYGNNLPLPSR